MNEAFRSHVTRVGFDLSLARSHIAALVWLDYVIKHDRGGPDIQQRRPPRPRHRGSAFNHFVMGVHGLQDRGLVVHTHPDTIKLPPGVKHAIELPARRIWRITPAGRMVIGLLNEAGIWQEYETELFPRIEAVS